MNFKRIFYVSLTVKNRCLCLTDSIVLKKRAQFLRVAAKKSAIVTPYFIVQYMWDEKSCTHHASSWLMGFTASRKVGKAVQRNFAKRRLREIVRLYQKNQSMDALLPYDGQPPVLHTVLIARQRLLSGTFSEIQQIFHKSMCRIIADHTKNDHAEETA